MKIKQTKPLKTIGDELQAIERSENIKPSDFARKLGMNPSDYYGKYRKRETKPTLWQRVALWYIKNHGLPKGDFKDAMEKITENGALLIGDTTPVLQSAADESAKKLMESGVPFQYVIHSLMKHYHLTALEYKQTGMGFDISCTWDASS